MSIPTLSSPLGDNYVLPGSDGGDGAAGVIGSILANGQSVELQLFGQAAVYFDVFGTFTGTLQFEFQSNSSWQVLNTTNAGSNAGGSIVGPTVTGPARRIANCAGMSAVRLVATSAITGTVNVAIRATDAMSLIHAFISGIPFFQGAVARGIALVGNPVLQGLRAATSNPGNVGNNQAVDALATVMGVQVARLNTIPELAWNFASAAGGITTTPDVLIVSAGGAGTRRYISTMNLSNNSATGTEFVVKDGPSTVLARFQLPPNAPNFPVRFEPPLAGGTNNPMNVACLTAGAAVFCNAQGFTAP